MALQDGQARSQGFWESWWRILVVIVLANLAFQTLDLIAAASPDEPIRAHLRQAFASGELTGKDHRPFDYRRGVHQFNDCLIFMLALSRSDSVWKDAVTPWYPVYEGPGAPGGMCGTLAEELRGSGRWPERRILYHRYLHGHRALAALLLQVLTVEQMRLLFHVAVYAVLALLPMIALWRCRDPATSVPGLGQRPFCIYFAVVTAIAFAAFYGLAQFGQSANHAPADLVLFGFIAWWIGAQPYRRSFASMLTGIAVFGCLTAYFEFLTGGLPLGLAVVIALVGLSPSPEGEERSLARRVFWGGAVFLAAVSLSFALNLLVAVLVFGPQIVQDTLLRLEQRMGHSIYARSAIMGTNHVASVLADAHARTRVLTRWDVLQALRWNLNQIAWGSHYLGYALMGLAGVQWLSGCCLTLRWGGPGSRGVWLAMALSPGVLLAWYMAFVSHTVEHGWFMGRMLVWVIVIGWLAVWPGWWRPLPAAGTTRGRGG